MCLWAQRIFAAGVILLLYFLIKMAPGVGDLRFLTYAACAIVVIVISILLFKLYSKNKSKKSILAMILVVVLLNTFAFGLRLLYESKYTSAITYLPPTGNIYVKMLVDIEYYSSSKIGSAYKPVVLVNLDGVEHKRNTSFGLTLDHNYIARVGCSYSYHGDVYGGYVDDTVNFKKADYKNPILYYYKTINISSTDYVMLTLKFTRVIGFWDVILFKA